MRNDGFGCILYLVIGIAILYTLSGLINTAVLMVHYKPDGSQELVEMSE